MTIATDEGWIDDGVCTCGEVIECDCYDKDADDEAVKFVDRMMTDEKFYDNIVGWF